jgi:hypothetical protein
MRTTKAAMYRPTAPPHRAPAPLNAGKIFARWQGGPEARPGFGQLKLRLELASSATSNHDSN